MFQKYRFFVGLFLIWGFTAQGTINLKQFKHSFRDYISKDIELTRRWELLSSIGWHFRVIKFAANDKRSFRYLEGKPFSKRSFKSLKRSHNTLAILINKNSKFSLKQLVKKIDLKLLNKLVDSSQSYEGWRVKFADRSANAIHGVSENIAWPDQADALGTGYEKYFRKVGKKDRASWSLKKEPSLFFKSLQTLDNIEYPYSSGCLVTLGVALNFAAFLTFDHPSVYDGSFPHLYINNSEFRSSEKSYLRRPDFLSDEVAYPLLDKDGTFYAEHGPHALIGQPGYISAVLEDVEQVDYFGENVVIAEISKEAAKELHKKGLGYYQDPMNPGYALTPEDFQYFSGVSADMISWWREFHKIYTKSTKKLKDSDLTEDVIAEYASRAINKIEKQKKWKKVYKKINNSLFNELILFGHPAGKLSLKEWMYELAKKNPNTPYSFMFYDYLPRTVLWPQYKKAYLSYEFF